MRTLSLGLIALLLVVSARAEDLVPLAREYRQLREVRGWFSGGDQWVEAVDSWNGRKHRVMGRLGALLGDGRHRAVEVEELMGPPDKTAAPGSNLWALAGGECGEGTQRMLIYSWRGGHDFLCFWYRDGQITGSHWWMAGE